MEPSDAVWIQLVDAITKRIQSGEYPAGERLPDNKALIAEYGVSGSTIDKAMAFLIALGRVRGRRGVGRYAVGPTEWFDANRNGFHTNSSD